MPCGGKEAQPKLGCRLDRATEGGLLKRGKFIIDDRGYAQDLEMYYISDMCTQRYRRVPICTLFWHSLEV